MYGYRTVNELNRIQLQAEYLDDETKKEVETFIGTEPPSILEQTSIVTLEEHFALLNCLPQVPGTRWTISSKIWWHFYEMLPPIFIPSARATTLLGGNPLDTFAICEASWGRCHVAYWREECRKLGDEALRTYNGDQLAEENGSIYWAGFVWLGRTPAEDVG